MSRSPIRRPTVGFTRMFFTQSLTSPPPDSMYTLPSCRANQISMVWGRPELRPVVVT